MEFCPLLPGCLYHLLSSAHLCSHNPCAFHFHFSQLYSFNIIVSFSKYLKVTLMSVVSPNNCISLYNGRLDTHCLKLLIRAYLSTAIVSTLLSNGHFRQYHSIFSLFQGKYIEVSFDFKGDTTGGAISNCKFSMILKHLNCFATGSVSISQNNFQLPFETDVFFPHLDYSQFLC